MLYYVSIFGFAILFVLAQALLAGVVLAGIAWWLALSVVACVVLVVTRLVVAALKPGMAGIIVVVALAAASLFGTFGAALAMLAVGNFDADRIEAELRALIGQSRAVEVFDAAGRPIGILPAVLDPDRADAPYLAVHIKPEIVPPVFWRCAVFLEDRGLGGDAWWRFQGLDFYRLGRAIISKFYLTGGGASTLAEMVDRSLRNALPKHPGLVSSLWDVPRKLASWRDLPSLTGRLFPAEPEFRAAVATHLPLMRGARRSAFGGEIRGIGLAALVLGKQGAEELSDAEAAVLAAAINLPLHIGGTDVETSWRKARVRADYCLARADFAAGFDRDRARREVAAVRPPLPPVRHPATNAMVRLGGRGPALIRELTGHLGPTWPQIVARVYVSARDGGIDLAPAMKRAARDVEQKQNGRLVLPLWPAEAAFVYGVVAESNGDIIATISNSDFDLSSAPVPIGSVAKIVAATALSAKDIPTAVVKSAFARSDSSAIARRLQLIGEDAVAETFDAFGWSVPHDRSARRLAAYGAVEVAPDKVLQATIALTDLLFADRLKPVTLVGLVKEVELTDGRRITTASSPLTIDKLRAIITPKRRSYIASVLAAPLTSGTMPAVGAALKAEGITRAWAKSGTADATSGGTGIAATRALWHVGGFVLGGRRFAFVMVVASRTGVRPLGFVQSPAIAPMTNALLKHAIGVAKTKGSVP